MHSALQPSLLRYSRRLNKTTSRIFNRRGRTFHRSSRRLSPKSPEDGAPPASNGDSQEPPAHDFEPLTPIARNQSAGYTLEKQPPRELIYYGSAARRQLRSRAPREPEPPTPEWFVDHNVHLPEDFTTADAPQTSPLQILSPSRNSKDFIGLPRRNHDTAAESCENDGVPGGESNNGKSGGPDDDPQYRDPVPLPGKRYFLSLPQFMEVMYTARGLMALPRPKFAGEFASLKSHLILHYPLEGGSYLLDELVENIAKRMHCDLITLDAQDIAELAGHSPLVENPPEGFRRSARLLSYDVYSRDAPAAFEDFDEEETIDLEEQEDGIDPPRVGTPVIVAKPITLNLNDLISSFGHGLSPRGRSRLPRPFLSGSDDDVGFNARTSRLILTGLIDTTLSGPCRRRDSGFTTNPATANAEGTEAPESTTGETEKSPNGTIVHVRDLRSIQNKAFGQQFLSALFDNIQSRRIARERIMIIGTESSSEENPVYSKYQIEQMQKGAINEVSRTIVLSPIMPNTDAKLALLDDGRRRTRIINMRHFWEQYRQKDREAIEHLPDGFWKLDPSEYFDIPDWSLFEKRVLSFGEIHRIVSLVVGMSDEKPFNHEKLSRALRHLFASDRIKFDWAEREAAKTGKPRRRVPIDNVSEDRLWKIRNTATKHEKRLLSCVIEPSKIRTTFNDVHAPVETIDALKTLTTLSLIRPDAFLYGVLASDKIPGLLLYGPPGTGKTLLAKAVAKESGATVLEVSAADINDMFVGEGEKNVKALFSLAKKLAPCVIFIDEADALFSARSNNHRRVSHRELINQFLKEWDGMSNDAGGAFIMVATNRPMDLDDAVLRRLPRRLLVDLPTENDRLEILKIHLRDEQLADNIDLSDVASKTKLYSGSDLKNLCVAAALSCVREENERAKSYTGEKPYKHADRRTLRLEHFTKALEEITASISEDMASLKDIKKFDEQFGDKRGKKRKSKKIGFNAAADLEKVPDSAKVRA